MKYFLSTFIVIGFCLHTKAAQFKTYYKDYGKESLPFLTAVDQTPEVFSQSEGRLKPDQALLQNHYRLNSNQRKALKAEDFQNMTQEEIDQIYIRLPSGPIQPGRYKGLVIQKVELVQKAKKLMLSKYKTTAKFGKLICGNQDLVECLAEMVWKGKRIYEPSPTGEIQLRNAISEKFGVALKAALTPVVAELDPQNKLIETREMFYGQSKFMLFPAHVYCGQSLFDHRRESILIDYAWGNDFAPFVAGIDNLAGREFLNIRDEIRMVRPGLYLGRAYTNNVFLLNFVLSNLEVEEKFNKDNSWPLNACFDGKVTR